MALPETFELALDRPRIHAYDGYMRKLQILFPEPQLRRLREIARRDDRPVSEVVRTAVQAWLDKVAPPGVVPAKPEVPVFHGGKITAKPGSLRDAAYADRTGPHE